MQDIELIVGQSRWSFRVPETKLIALRPRAVHAQPVANPRAAVRAALDKPLHLDFPLSRALTPDDRIALVIDEQLPRLGELVAGVLDYLAAAGIGPEAVTILSAPEHGSQAWIDELPDEFADVHTEVHQPGDRKQLSYLAATKKGRRIYLNRTLVDADQIISLSGRRYDPQLGYTGAEGSLYPALSDAETRRTLSNQLSKDAPTLEPEGARAEAAEIAWLLGAPIFVQVIEDGGDGIASVCAGLVDSSAEGVRRQDDRWRFSIPRPADVVVAAVSGGPGSTDFAAIAQAVACAARVVKDGGALVVLSEIEPALGEGMEMLCAASELAAGLRQVGDKKPTDIASAFQWASAGVQARIYLACGLSPETVEEIFAVPVHSPAEVQRLIDRSADCLFVPDAQRSLVVIE
jgi:nickel-dependent lactate racemase